MYGTTSRTKSSHTSTFASLQAPTTPLTMADMLSRPRVLKVTSMGTASASWMRKESTSPSTGKTRTAAVRRHLVSTSSRRQTPSSCTAVGMWDGNIESSGRRWARWRASGRSLSNETRLTQPNRTRTCSAIESTRRPVVVRVLSSSVGQCSTITAVVESGNDIDRYIGQTLADLGSYHARDVQTWERSLSTDWAGSARWLPCCSCSLVWSLYSESSCPLPWEVACHVWLTPH